MAPRLTPTLQADPLWYKDAIIYEVHVRAFQDSDADGMGDFRGLTQRLPYLADLGVTALWLLPFYPSPWRDDGYDISDYTTVHPAYGTLRDFQNFLTEAHKRGLRVISELVLNHTSDQHVWFQRSRRASPGTRWRNYYVWSDTPQKYSQARIIFKDFESSNWAWDPIAKAYYWHRFYSHQPDLNFDNPEVREVMMGVLDYWFEMGVDGLRLDAVPYLYEREGTDGENLPETHAYLKELRAHINQKFSDRMLLAEANQWPEDAIRYFGDGDECHMAFHFPLMPRLFMATRLSDRYPVTDILQLTPPVPPNCQWALFLRNHDELTLEMVTDEERDYMYRVFAHDRTMRINLGIRRRLAPLLENDRERIQLMNGLLFSLPGSPVVYYGDEIGMGDNFYLGDRNGVRTPMQWNRDRNAGFSMANPQKLYLPIVIDPEYHYEALNVENQQNNAHSLLWWMKQLIGQRKQFQAFGRGDLEFLYPDNRRILAFVRSWEDERVLVVANLARVAQCCHLPMEKYKGLTPVEVFGNTTFPQICDEPYFLSLAPHGFYWFALARLGADSGSLRPSDGVEQLPEFAVTSLAEAMSPENRRAIERYLPVVLKKRAIWRDRTGTLLATPFEDVIAAKQSRSWLTLVRFESSAGETQLYSFPLGVAEAERAEQLLRDVPDAVLGRVQGANGETGILYGGSRSSDFQAELFGLMLRRKKLSGERGVLSGAHTPAFRRIWQHTPELEPALEKADHNSSVIRYGSKFVLKLYRRVEEGTHPELEILAALGGLRERPNVPLLAGSLEYRQLNGAPIAIGILTEQLDAETTAWQVMQDHFNLFLESAVTESYGRLSAEQRADFTDVGARKLMGSFVETLALLGQRTAETHMALASVEASDFRPEPYTDFYQLGLYHGLLGLRNRMLGAIEQWPRRSDSGNGALDAVTQRQNDITALLQSLRELRFGGQRIRIHGDFDLHEALFNGKDFYFIDFEGQSERPLSERRIKRSPLRDVAGVIESLFAASHERLYGRVAGVAQTEAPSELLEAIASAWFRNAASGFERGYYGVAGIERLLPSDRERMDQLLRIFRLEQSMRALLRALPDDDAMARTAAQSILFALDGGSSAEQKQ